MVVRNDLDRFHLASTASTVPIHLALAAAR
jgi:hypothetical protein